MSFCVRELYMWDPYLPDKDTERWKIPVDELYLYRKAMETSPYFKEYV